MNELIFIAGLSATGKTTLSTTYNNHALVHTDDFIKHGIQSPYYINRVLERLDGDVVVEGIGCYQYLIDMHKYGFTKPDYIIHLNVSKEKRVSRLVERYSYSDKSFSMDALHLAMWEKFKRIKNNIIIEERYDA